MEYSTRGQEINDLPAMVLVSAEQTRKAIEATHQLSRHHGRVGTLQQVVERYWWPEIYVNVKDWVKTYQQCEKRDPLRYDETLTSLTVSHLR